MSLPQTFSMGLTRANNAEETVRVCRGDGGQHVIGRKNWLFVGSDEAAEVNAAFVSLLASCQLHGIEPWAYLRDLFCLLPSWPVRRVLEPWTTRCSTRLTDRSGWRTSCVSRT